MPVPDVDQDPQKKLVPLVKAAVARGSHFDPRVTGAKSRCCVPHLLLLRSLEPTFSTEFGRGGRCHNLRAWLVQTVTASLKV